jgi:hypothetical protein
MRIKLLILVLMLLPSLANAATYYVRPLGGSYGTEDGTSYANAFDGFADISGLAAGDTLYVCGAHSEAFTTPISGTSVAQMIVDGRCPSDAGSLNIGGGARNIIMNDGVGEDFWTFRYLTISGGTSAGTALYCNGTTDCNGVVFEYNTVTCTNASANTQAIRVRSPKAVIIQYNTLDGSSGACGNGIILDTAAAPLTTHINNYIEHNTVHGFGGIAIRINGVNQTDYNPGPNYVRYNTTYDNGDGIYHVNADQITNSYNISYGNNRTNYAGEGYGFASTWCDKGVWTDNIGNTNRTKAIEIYTDNLRLLTSATSGATIRRNSFQHNPTEVIVFRATIDVNNGSPGTPAWVGVVVADNIVVGGTNGIDIADGVVATVANNTIIDPLYESGILLENGANNVTVINNLIKMTSGAALYGLWASNGSGTANVYKNNLFWVGAVTVNLAHINTTNYTAGTITGLDAGAVVSNPLLLSTYRTGANSPARRAGTAWGGCSDYRGRACYPDHPDIGAYQMSSGDQANTRSARQ